MSKPTSDPPLWLAWMRLARLSNLPSALSNILMGFLLVNPTWQPVPSLLLLLLATSCLYSAGMILNDVYDLEADRETSPNRPLPSGQIGRSTAQIVGFALCALGIGSAALAGALGSGWVVPTAVASVLALSIWLYDCALKKTPLAPALMGFCRTCNVLLGASVLAEEFLVHQSAVWFGFSGLVWWVALSIGIYVTGLTLFARSERKTSSRTKLGGGLALMVLGIAGLALVPECDEMLKAIDNQRFGGLFGLIILMISVTIVRSAIVTLLNPKPQFVQKTVITALRSMIIFDACIVFLFTSGQIAYTLIVVSLIAVSLILGKWIRGT